MIPAAPQSVGQQPATSAVPQDRAAPGSRVCLDCGTVLSGKFCYVCGQKDEPLKRGLKDLVLEFAQHPLIDTKLWRSLVPLLFRPGVLTEQYLAGRRTRYLRPLKLYLTVSVLFFAIMALRPTPQLIHISDNNGHVPKPVDVALEAKESGLSHWINKRMTEKTKGLDAAGIAAMEQSVSAKTVTLIPRVVFVLLPLSAILFKLLWRKRYFVEHLVFALHLHSFAFAGGTLLLTRWVPVAVVFGAWSAVYAVLAFKRVYRSGWVATLSKLLGVAFLYLLLMAAAMAVTTLWVFIRG